MSSLTNGVGKMTSAEATVLNAPPIGRRQLRVGRRAGRFVDDRERTQRVVAEAAHVVDAAGEEVLEERQAGKIRDVVRIARRQDARRRAPGVAVAEREVSVERQVARDRQVLAVTIEQRVVLDRRAGQHEIELHLLQRAARRVPVLVARVVRPGELRFPGVERVVADVVDVVDELLRRADHRRDAGLADAELRVDRVRLGDRNRQIRVERIAVGQVAREVVLAGVEFGVVDVVAEANAVGGQVRLEIRELVALEERALLRGDADLVAGAEEVVLRDRDAGDEALHLRVAEAEGEAARVLLLDRDDDVDLILGAGHLGRIDRDGLEVAEALQADLRAVDRGLRIPGAFELAHLAAHDFVFGVRVALEDDVAHVDALARIDEEVDADFALLAVDRRNRLHVGERVADVGEHGRDRVGRLLDLLAREEIAGLDLQELAQVILVEDQRAGQLDVADRVDLAFLDVGGHVHLALVGADRDLGGVDVEVDVAAIHVVRGQLFQIARKLLARVLIVLGVERQPVRCVRLEAGGELLVRERLVADDVDLLDRRGLALGDVDRDLDAVAIEVDDGRLHRDVVLAAVVVLARELVLHLGELERIERLAFGQANALEALQEILVLEILVAAQRDLGDLRALLDRDDEDVALARELHVVEEAGLVQRADRLLGAVRRQLIALLDRKIGEHRAGRDARQAVDADVRDGERLERESVAPGETGEQE